MTADEDERRVVVERALPYPPAKIWRALTQPHLLEEWLMKGDIRAVPGHAFTLTKQPAPGITVEVACKVIASEENRSLSYTWSAYGLDTVVTFELEPTATGALLRVRQDGFPADQKAAYKGARASWPQFLDSLNALLSRLD